MREECIWLRLRISCCRPWGDIESSTASWIATVGWGLFEIIRLSDRQETYHAFVLHTVYIILNSSHCDSLGLYMRLDSCTPDLLASFPNTDIYTGWKEVVCCVFVFHEDRRLETSRQICDSHTLRSSAKVYDDLTPNATVHCHLFQISPKLRIAKISMVILVWLITGFPVVFWPTALSEAHPGYLRCYQHQTSRFLG